MMARDRVDPVLGQVQRISPDDTRYDTPGPEAVGHRSEIDFATTARADGVRFQSITYHDVVIGLAKGERDSHREYVDCLAGRYL